MPKPKGVNPVSLENLHPGSEPRHGEPKRPRNVSVTDTGWRNLKQQAQSRGLSLAEFLELIGRGELQVQDPV